MYQFKAKYQEIKSCPCFNVSKDFTIDNEKKKKKTKLKGGVSVFFLLIIILAIFYISINS